MGGKPSGGLLRWKCMYCNAVFASLVARETHLITDHDNEAA